MHSARIRRTDGFDGIGNRGVFESIPVGYEGFERCPALGSRPSQLRGIKQERSGTVEEAALFKTGLFLFRSTMRCIIGAALKTPVCTVRGSVCRIESGNACGLTALHRSQAGFGGTESRSRRSSLLNEIIIDYSRMELSAETGHARTLMASPTSSAVVPGVPPALRSV